MNYTQKALVLLLGIFFLLGFFLLFIYRPKAERLSRLQAEDKALDIKLNEIDIKKNRLPEAIKEIEICRQKLKRLELQYPRTIESVYQAITDAARKVGFNILKRKTIERPVKDETLAVKEHDIKIIARSPYQVLGEFLDEISRLPVIVSVSGLTILRDEVSIPEGKVVSNLDVELRLTTHLSKE